MNITNNKVLVLLIASSLLRAGEPVPKAGAGEGRVVYGSNSGITARPVTFRVKREALKPNVQTSPVVQAAVVTQASVAPVNNAQPGFVQPFEIDGNGEACVPLKSDYGIMEDVQKAFQNADTDNAQSGFVKPFEIDGNREECVPLKPDYGIMEDVQKAVQNADTDWTRWNEAKESMKEALAPWNKFAELEERGGAEVAERLGTQPIKPAVVVNNDSGTSWTDWFKDIYTLRRSKDTELIPNQNGDLDLNFVGQKAEDYAEVGPLFGGAIVVGATLPFVAAAYPVAVGKAALATTVATASGVALAAHSAKKQAETDFLLTNVASLDASLKKLNDTSNMQLITLRAALQHNQSNFQVNSGLPYVRVPEKESTLTQSETLKLSLKATGVTAVVGVAAVAGVACYAAWRGACKLYNWYQARNEAKQKGQTIKAN